MMNETIRIWRSPASDCGYFSPDAWHEETITALNTYTDAELSSIAASGFNAIWIYGQLNHVVRTAVFPELGTDAELHQQRMNALTERARRHGIMVFMFCQSPLSIPCDDPFWHHHADVAGQIETITEAGGREIKVQALCTSTDKVKNYLYQSAAELAKKIPDLSGVIMITASELPAHCWSKRGRVIQADGSFARVAIECPRCSRRKPETVVSEIIQLLREGIRSVNLGWKIIAWNWSWTFYLPSPCNEIIAALPSDVILQVDFERGGHKIIAGKRRTIDEYSLSFVGPSEQFQKSLEAARNNGLQVMAKLQFGTTHELATVPNLPVMGNVFAKADAVRDMNLAGFMGCWTFGNMITANTAGFNAFLAGKLPPDRDDALRTFAAEYFPGCNAYGVAAAWLKFDEAMDHYPFSIPWLYSGPANFSFILPMKPAPLSGKSLGFSHMLDERGDDMGAVLSDYSIEEIIAEFEQLAAIWFDGLQLLRAALDNCTHIHACEELNTATVCWHSFRSIVNFCTVYALRREWSDTKLLAYRVIIADELENLQEVLPVLQQDSRFGYHIEAHGYQYDADGVAQKIDNLQRQLQALAAK